MFSYSEELDTSKIEVLVSVVYCLLNENAECPLELKLDDILTLCGHEGPYIRSEIRCKP